MQTITGIIIAKNNESTIEELIKSIDFCDELIIIDGGSTDKTVERAKKAGAQVFIHTNADFAEKRNMGLSHATKQWILYIDTDERIDKRLRESIINVLKNPGSFSAYKLKRKNYYLGNNSWPYREELERFFKKENLESWVGPLHESPIYKGEIGLLNGYLLHFTHRNLSEMVEKTNQWSEIEALTRFNNNHPKVVPWRLVRVMVTAFFDSFIKQSGWKAGTVGIVESMYQSFSIFITYIKLWELQKRGKR